MGEDPSEIAIRNLMPHQHTQLLELLVHRAVDDELNPIALSPQRLRRALEGAGWGGVSGEEPWERAACGIAVAACFEGSDIRRIKLAGADRGSRSARSSRTSSALR